MATAFDYRVEDRAAFARPGVADEEPVFLADGRRADGVLHAVVVDLDADVIEEILQRGPLAQANSSPGSIKPSHLNVTVSVVPR